jgi:hypothetical protein
MSQQARNAQVVICGFFTTRNSFEITGAAKGVFTHSQSSCHIAKVVLTIRHDSRQIPIASDAPPFHTSRGFLHWRFAYAGPTVRAAPPSWGRHPQTFTESDLAVARGNSVDRDRPGCARDRDFCLRCLSAVARLKSELRPHAQGSLPRVWCARSLLR